MTPRVTGAGLADPGGVREWALAADRGEVGRRREDGEAFGAFWQQIVDGRLRLVKRFDSDGRRYYVARESVASSRSAALDPRERLVAETIGTGASEKVAAYKLGIPSGTISAKLRTTLFKLGLRTRVDLVMFVGATGAGASTRSTSSEKSRGPRF